MGLCLTLRFKDLVKIGDAIVMVEKYGSNQIRINIEAPMSTKIERIKQGENNEYKSVSIKNSKDGRQEKPG